MAPTTTIPRFPEHGHRADHAAVYIPEWESVMVLGGRNNNNSSLDDETHYLDSTLLLDMTSSSSTNNKATGTATSQWQCGPRLTTAKAGVAAAYCNGKVYVVGGDSSIGPSIQRHTTIEVLDCSATMEDTDLETETTTTTRYPTWKKWQACSLRIARANWHQVLVLANRFLLVLGGDYSWNLSSTLEVFDTVTERHQVFQTNQPPREQHKGAALAGNHLVVVEPNGKIKQVEINPHAQSIPDIFHTMSSSGIQFQPIALPMFRSLHLSINKEHSSMIGLDDGSLLVIGGGKHNDEDWSNQVQRVTLHPPQCVAYATLARPRTHMASVLVPNSGIVITGGQCTDSYYHNEWLPLLSHTKSSSVDRVPTATTTTKIMSQAAKERMWADWQARYPLPTQQELQQGVNSGPSYAPQAQHCQNFDLAHVPNAGSDTRVW